MNLTHKNNQSLLTSGLATHGWDAILTTVIHRTDLPRLKQHIQNSANTYLNCIPNIIINNESMSYQLSGLKIEIPTMIQINESSTPAQIEFSITFISAEIRAYNNVVGSERYLKRIERITKDKKLTFNARVSLASSAVTNNIKSSDVYITLSANDAELTNSAPDGGVLDAELAEIMKETIKKFKLPAMKYGTVALSTAQTSILSPTAVKMRIAAGRIAANKDESISFIRAKSSAEGSIPSALPQLIPVNAVWDFALLLSFQAVLRDIVAPYFTKGNPEATVSLPASGGNVMTITTKITDLNVAYCFEDSTSGSSCLISNVGNTMKFNGINFLKTEKGFKISYEANTNQIFQLNFLDGASEGKVLKEQYAAKFKIDIWFNLEYNESYNKITFMPVGNPTWKITSYNSSLFSTYVSGALYGVKHQLDEQLDIFIRDIIDSLSNYQLDVAALFNNSADDQINITSVTLPYDIVICGLAAKTTPPELTTTNCIVSPGEKFKFSLKNNPTATWSVKTLDGKSAGLGTITASGEYVAPQASKLNQHIFQEIILATTGTRSTQGAATIMAKHVTVTPVYFYTGSRSEKITLTAKTARDTHIVSWKILTSGAGGTLIAKAKVAEYLSPASLNHAIYAADVISVENNTTKDNDTMVVLHFARPQGMASPIDFLPRDEIFLSRNGKVDLQHDYTPEYFSNLARMIKAEMNLSSPAESYIFSMDTESANPYFIAHGGGSVTNVVEDDVYKTTYTAPATYSVNTASVCFVKKIKVLIEEPTRRLRMNVTTYGYKIINFSDA